MRWLWVLAALGCVSCLRPVTDVVDAGAGTSADASVPPDAGPAPEPYDPCVWDGLGDGLCFADTGVVFDGTECRHVCGAQPQPGRAGVFANEAECQATCPCNPEKFVLWPSPGAAGPLALGGHCDQIEAVTDAGAAVPWPAEACQRAALWAQSGDQTCSTGIVGGVDGRLNRRALAEVCRVSALPQVRQVVCVVWVD